MFWTVYTSNRNSCTHCFPFIPRKLSHLRKMIYVLLCWGSSSNSRFEFERNIAILFDAFALVHSRHITLSSTEFVLVAATLRFL